MMRRTGEVFLVVLLAFSFGGIALVALVGDGVGCEEFDRGEWIAAQREHGEESTRIATCLVDRSVLIGRREAEVRAMLGPPEVPSRRRPLTWLYELGPDSPGEYALDSRFLLIEFDPAGRAEQTQVFTG